MLRIDPVTTARARTLRRNPTQAEQVLWTHLRRKAIDGLKFRRQARIGPYIADFLCCSAKLVIEVDGGIHRLREAEDAVRSAWLRSRGYTVLRVSNTLVLARPHAVLALIRQHAQPSLGRGAGGREAARTSPQPAAPYRQAPPDTFPRERGKDVLSNSRR